MHTATAGRVYRKHGNNAHHMAG